MRESTTFKMRNYNGKCELFVYLLLFCYSISYCQKGIDGVGSISGASTVVNEYTYLTSDAAVGATSITVNNNNLNTNGRFSTGPLAAGSLIMIIQMQGATINSAASDSTWGTITNYNNSGWYEFAEVESVSGTTTINLKCSLNNSYTASGNVQLVRVPRYSALTINSGGTLTGDTWDGTKGGIVAAEVQGNTVISGTINATGIGFRGGVLQNGSSSNTTGYAYTNEPSGGEKGESIAGYEAVYDALDGGRYGRGAPANGGGGGNAINCGGGGGANSGNINTYNGNGNPDPTYTSAWNLEYSGFANSTSSGGGRGGYGAAAGNGLDPLTVPPGNTGWGFGNRTNSGGKGGRPLDYSTGRIFLGGGGGAGSEDQSNGGGGGAGGGICVLLSYGTIGGAGNILSNGENGGTASGPSGEGDAPGGAGGGGTIILNSAGAISGISIQANGGAGGNQVLTGTNPTESEGGGGGGGGGYIAISNGSVTSQAFGGAEGTTNSVSMSTFPPDGSTSGGAGISNAVYTFNAYSCLSANIVVQNVLCNGSCTGTANVSITVGAGPYAYSWNNGKTTQSLANLCAGNYTVTISDAAGNTTTAAVTITQPPALTVTVTGNLTVTNGQSAILSASGGETYLWSNGATGAHIIVSPTATTVYCVTIVGANNCADSACVTVTFEIDCRDEIYVPDAFSPNNDNYNDVLYIRTNESSCIQSIAFRIFDRWGNKVFESFDPAQGWNGMYKGKELDNAVFVYSLQATLINGTSIIKKGNLSLIK